MRMAIVMMWFVVVKAKQKQNPRWKEMNSCSAAIAHMGQEG